MHRQPINILGIGWTAATISWMVFIFYISSLTGSEVTQQIDAKPAPWIGHIVLFGTLAAFLYLAIRGWNIEITLHWVIAIVIFSSLFGISDEYHQSFVAGRHATVTDALIDSIGSTVTAISMWIFGRSTSWRKNTEP